MDREIYVGGDCVIRAKDVVGLFDIENTTSGKITREFLNKAAKSGKVIYPTNDLPQSFIVTGKRDEQRVYLSKFSTKQMTVEAGNYGNE